MSVKEEQLRAIKTFAPMFQRDEAIASALAGELAAGERPVVGFVAELPGKDAGVKGDLILQSVSMLRNRKTGNKAQEQASAAGLRLARNMVVLVTNQRILIREGKPGFRTGSVNVGAPLSEAPLSRLTGLQVQKGGAQRGATKVFGAVHLGFPEGVVTFQVSDASDILIEMRIEALRNGAAG